VHPLGMAVRRRLSAVAVAAVLGVGVRTGAASDQLYSIRDLGTLGGPVSQALSVNASGHVVGTADVPDGRSYHAFLFTGGPLLDLGTFGGSRSTATAINTSGLVVGFAWTEGDKSAHAFLYANGAMQDLGAFGIVGEFNSSALDINDAGQVVGWAVLPDLSAHAFLYRDGLMKDLGTLGGRYSEAAGINATGQVCGSSQSVEESEWRAFVYANGVMKSLGTLGGDESHAYGINDAGQVVGWSFNATAASAFLYSDGVMKDLGTLGGSGSLANAINASGQVVGASAVKGSRDAHAFLWQNGVMKDLNDLIPTASGWVLLEARRITDAGVIVGYGSLNGQIRPFMLTPLGQ
jgi:probable HAF family extracellular repeat protein